MIIKQTALIPNFLGQPNFYYLEKGTGRKFRRISGGMQWPGTNPGALVVVAEDLNMDMTLGEHKFWILAEYENRNPSELVTRCMELNRLMKVEKFYGDTTNRPMMMLMRRSKEKISLSKAPFVDDPSACVTYLTIIREKTSAIQKVLYFEKGSVLPAMLSALSGIPTDIKSEYPKIAALGYALSALIAYPYKKPREYGVGYKPLDPIVGI